MRRVFLRGRENILKRMLIHNAALNLGLLFGLKFGRGTPWGFQGSFNGYSTIQMALLCGQLILDTRRQLERSVLEIYEVDAFDNR